MASVERAASGSSGTVSASSSGRAVRGGRRSLGAAFRRLWWATGISASGDGLLAVAVPLLALTLTKNPLIIAGLTGANRAAAAVAALPGGLVADRWDRGRVMVTCNLLAGITILALVAALTIGAAELVMLYLVAVVLAACDVTYTLAVQAALPDVVSQQKLAVGNGRLIAVEGAGEQFIGPATGGILFSLAQRLPFLVDGISFFVSAGLVARGLPRRQHLAGKEACPGEVPLVSGGHNGNGDPNRAPAAWADAASNGARSVGVPSNHPRANGAADPQGPTDDPIGASAPMGPSAPIGPSAPVGDVRGHGSGRLEGRPRWVVDFRQGLSLFNSDAALKLLAAVAALGALCQTMVFAILVLYGKETLHLTSTGYGIFLAFAAAIGVAGAHFAGHLQHRFGSGQLMLGGLMLGVASYIGLAFTHSVVLAVLVFGLQEIGTVAANVASVTARQHIIPRHLYGRVGSVHRLAVLSASAAGALLGGLVASASSVAATMVTAGVLLFVVTVIFAPWLLRTLPAAGDV